MHRIWIAAFALAIGATGSAHADFYMRAGAMPGAGQVADLCATACTLRWNGNWVNKSATTSLCSVTSATGEIVMKAHGGVETGVINGQGEAPGKCNAVATAFRFSGKWGTVDGGKTRVCGCTNGDGAGGGTPVLWVPNPIDARQPNADGQAELAIAKGGVEPASASRGLTFNFDFDPAMTAAQKGPKTLKMLNAARDYLNMFIRDTDTIAMKVKVAPLSAVAEAGPDLWATNTDSRTRPQTCTMTIGSDGFNTPTGEVKGNNYILIAHEMMHCLGFNSAAAAFKAKLPGTWTDDPASTPANKKPQIYTGAFNGPTVMSYNGGKPVDMAKDGSHFSDSFKAPGGKYPLMGPSGGWISVFDLAALKDIGYDIDFSSAAPPPACIGVKFGTQFADWTYDSNWKTSQTISGGCGDDVLTAETSTEPTLLYGGRGSDTLVSSTSAQTVMYGEYNEDIEAGVAPSPTTYKLVSNKLHVIPHVRTNDKIVISKALVASLTAQAATDAAKLQAVLNSMEIDTSNPDSLPQLGKNASGPFYFPLKIKFGSAFAFYTTALRTDGDVATLLQRYKAVITLD